MKPAPVLRSPGAKWRIAEWIASHLPEHDTYVEAFFGSGAVLFHKDPSRVEIVNDLDRNVVTLFEVLREQPLALIEALELTPWAADEYETSRAKLARGDLSKLERARCLIVATWQQMGRKPVSVRSSWRLRQVSAQNPVTTWRALPERIQAAAARLRDVQVSNMDAVKLIGLVQGPDVLIYADPPYLSEVRGNSRMYEHELRTREGHAELLDALRAHIGPVVLSGYPNDFYDAELPGWHSTSTSARTQVNAHRAETLWINPVAWRRLQHAQPHLLRRRP